MPRDLRAHLHDIRDACQAIEEFVRNKSHDEYASDRMLRSAVERQFIVVGEALLQALRLAPEIARSISDSRRIINFRNVLVHGYALVENETVWGVITESLPVLRRQVEALLGEEKPE
jgi:uncharacterized protein with HEPN domain